VVVFHFAVVPSPSFTFQGLVRQQLDSFNEFIEMSAQQIVSDTPQMELDCASQHHSNEKDDGVSWLACLDFLAQRHFEPLRCVVKGKQGPNRGCLMLLVGAIYSVRSVQAQD
jgi:hypothetical protein